MTIQKVSIVPDKRGVRNATDRAKELVPNAFEFAMIVAQVQEGELYRHLGYSTFNAYCQAEFGIGAGEVRKSIAASVSIQDADRKKLSTKIENPAPERTRVDRTPDVQRVVARQVAPAPEPSPVVEAPVRSQALALPAKPSKVVSYGTDDFGNAVTYQETRALLDTAEEVRIIRKMVVDIRKRVAAMKDTPVEPYYGAVSDDIEAAISDLLRNVDYCIVTRVCPVCSGLGKTCKACRRTGGLSKAQYERYLKSQDGQ